MAQPTSLLPRVPAAMLAGAPVPLALPLDSVGGSKAPASNAEPSPGPLSAGDMAQLHGDGVGGAMTGRGNLVYAFGSPGPDVSVHLVVRGGGSASGAAACEAGAGDDAAGCAVLLPPSAAGYNNGAAGGAQQQGTASQSVDPSWLVRHGNCQLPGRVEPAPKIFFRRQAGVSEAAHDQPAIEVGAQAQDSGAWGSPPPVQGGPAAAGLPGSEGDECAAVAQAPETGAAMQAAQQHGGPGDTPGQHQPHVIIPALAHSQSHTAPPQPLPPPGPITDAIAEAATADAIEADDPAPQAAGDYAGQDHADDEDEDDVVFIGCTPGATPLVSQEAAAWLRGAGRPRSSQRTPAPGGGAAGPSGRTSDSASKQQRSILNFVRPTGAQGRAGNKATGARGRGGSRGGGRSGLAGLGSWGGSQPAPSARLHSPVRVAGVRTGGVWEQEGLSQPSLVAFAHQPPPRPDTLAPVPRPPTVGGSLFGSQAGRAASVSLGADAASHGRQHVSGGGQGATGRLGRQGSGAAGTVVTVGAAAARTSLGACGLADGSDDDNMVEEAISRQQDHKQPAGGGTDRAGDAAAVAEAAAAGAGVAEVGRGDVQRCAMDVDIVPASCVPDSYVGLLTQGATLAGTCEDAIAAAGATANEGAAAVRRSVALGFAGGSEEEVVPATPLSVQGSELQASGLAGAYPPGEGPRSVRSSAGYELHAGSHAADGRAGAGGAGCPAGPTMIAATPLPPAALQQHQAGVAPTPLPGAGAAVVAIGATPEHALCDVSAGAGLLPAEGSGGVTPVPGASLLTARLSTAPATAAAAAAPSCHTARPLSADRTARVIHHGRLAPPGAGYLAPGNADASAATTAGAAAEQGHDELLHPGLVLEVHVGISGVELSGSCGVAGSCSGAGRLPGPCNFISCLVMEPPPGAGPDSVTPAGVDGKGLGVAADASGDKNNAYAAAASGPPAEPAGRAESSAAARPRAPEDSSTPRPTAHPRRRLQSLPSAAGTASVAGAASAPRPARRLLMLYTWAMPQDQPPQLHSVLPLSAPGTARQALATPGIPATPSPLPVGMAGAGCGSGGSGSSGSGCGSELQMPGVGHALKLLVGGDGSPALLLASQLSCATATSAGRRSPSAEPAGNNGGSGGGMAASLRSPLPTAGGCSSASGSGSGRPHGGVQLLRYSEGSWRLSYALQPPQLDMHADGRGNGGGSSFAVGVPAAAGMLCVSAAACAAREQHGGSGGEFWQVVAAGEGGHGCVWRLPAGLAGAPLQQAKLPQVCPDVCCKTRRKTCNAL